MNATGYLWPTPAQMLLLRAALDSGKAARRAWLDWCAHIDLSGPVDAGSLGLLPLVHANLGPQAEPLPHAGLIAGIRRRSFVETQRALAAAAEVLPLLASAGIPAMVLKGIPLGLAYYPAPGQRPMSDADILVDQHQGEAAMAVLEAAGWRSGQPEWQARRRSLMAVRHAVELDRGSGAVVDLHWRPLHERLPADAARDLWARAIPIDVGGVATLRPDATFLLMHVLLHGVRRNVKAPLRWIPDALAVLARDGSRIDWDWLVTTSRRARMRHRLGLALTFLRAEFDAPIPASVLAMVRGRPTLVERLENRSILADPSSRFALDSYRSATVLRMLFEGAPMAIPALVWHKLTQRA